LTVRFTGRVGYQQRVLAAYRTSFFDRLAERCSGGLEVFAGRPRAGEGNVEGDALHVARLVSGRNVHIGSGKLYLCWQRGLIGWLRRFKPDVLIAPANPRLLNTHVGRWMMHGWGRPVIGGGLGTLEWPEADRWTSAFRGRLLGQFYRSFDLLIAYSSKGAEDYVLAGVPPERVIVAHNAVDGGEAEAFFGRLSAHPEIVSRWRYELGLSTRPTILFVGRLVPQKRVDNLIRACAALQDGCELLIAGDGPQRPQLERLADKMFPRARFLGHRSGEDLALAFANADLFVLPGTGGLAIHEAMIHGKPVIVGRSDGTQVDLVQEGRNGYNLPSGDAATLGRVIATALADPDGLQRMGLESRRIATEGITLDAMTDAYVRALNLVTEGRAAKRPGR